MTSGNADAAFGQRLSLKVRLPGLPHAPGGARGTRPRHPQREDPPAKAAAAQGPLRPTQTVALWGCCYTCAPGGPPQWLSAGGSLVPPPRRKSQQNRGPGRACLQSSGESPLTRPSMPRDPCTREVTVSFGHVLLPCDCFYAHWPPPKKLTILRFRSLRH